MTIFYHVMWLMARAFHLPPCFPPPPTPSLESRTPWPPSLYDNLGVDAAPQVDPGEIEGTDLRVLKYPHPALRAENEEIGEFNDEIKKLVKEMFKVRGARDALGRGKDRGARGRSLSSWASFDRCDVGETGLWRFDGV